MNVNEGHIVSDFSDSNGLYGSVPNFCLRYFGL